MPKRNYFQAGQLTDLAYLVLLALTVPRHGYLIMSKIDELTAGEVMIGPATLYTTLKKLSDAGFIALQEDDQKVQPLADQASGRSNTKKVYLITGEGLSALQAEIDKRQRFARYGQHALAEYAQIKSGGKQNG